MNAPVSAQPALNHRPTTSRPPRQAPGANRKTATKLVGGDRVYVASSGNGIVTMVEAGDPIQLSPIRTTNLSQGFQGFWRPTA
jgi:hypothetical protein